MVIKSTQKGKVGTIWPMDLVFMSTFDDKIRLASLYVPLWFSLTLHLQLNLSDRHTTIWNLWEWTSTTIHFLIWHILLTWIPSWNIQLPGQPKLCMEYFIAAWVCKCSLVYPYLLGGRIWIFHFEATMRGLWSSSPPSLQTLCHWSNPITNLKECVVVVSLRVPGEGPAWCSDTFAIFFYY